MPDWSASMQQTFEYYVVDPRTWKDVKVLNNIKSSSISRDSDSETLGSASIDISDSLDECYVRTYLVTIQNGVRERFPLGTHLVQTPSMSFDGKTKSNTLDAYTPLMELKESMPPLGYSVLKDENIMETAYKTTREHVRAPVVKAECSTSLAYDFVSDPSDTWSSFNSDLIANAKYSYGLDELGRIIFMPNQDIASLQPVWTYTNDNSSILNPELSINRDLYGIPNVVEVLYSSGNDVYYSKVVNDNPNSPISTVGRGREICYRDTNPSIVGNSTQKQIDEYAEQLLRNLSSLEYTISYTHGYCPVRVGDCVRINYPQAGLIDVKAKVISQSIKCTPGCPVSEKAVFTNKLWR